MKKLRFLWIIVLIAMIALAGCGGSEPPPEDDPAEEDVADLFEKGREIEELYYEIVMEGAGVQSEGKVWLKKNKMKMEMTVAGQTNITIIDGEAETAYMYMPEENMAIKLPFTSTEEDLTETPADFLDYDESLISMGETVMLNGVECLKVTIQDEYPVTMWIHKEYGIPVRVEVDMGDETMTWEYRNISTAPIPDEVFSLPEGVTIIGS
jgi:outer membrane lipoprotein-sorting protein